MPSYTTFDLERMRDKVSERIRWTPGTTPKDERVLVELQLQTHLLAGHTLEDL